MSGINKAIILGRLGKDPDSKQLSDSFLTTFTVATSQKGKKKDGTDFEATEWHNISVFGKLAEICAKHLFKGSQVYIEGRISTRKYEKDGVTRYATGIVAEKVEFLGDKQRQHEAQSTVPSNSLPPAEKEADNFPF